MPITHLLFDLDDTLYTGATGIFGEVGERIVAWTAHALGISREAAADLRREYFALYGTTLAGLRQHHPEVDLEDYLYAVHDVDVTQYLVPDSALGAMLSRLPARKVIFTNGISEWAERILAQLEVREHFERIIDIRAVDYVGKPYPLVYAKALALLGASGPECVLLDDQARNLQGGAAFGMRTILVREDSVPEDGVEFAAPHILAAEPYLWRLLGIG